MNKWINIKDEVPELGQKVLCFKKGDIYVAYYFDGNFFCIPFIDSKFCKMLLKPEKWQKIDFPVGFHGKMLFSLPSCRKLVTASKFKELEREDYDEMIQKMLNAMNKDPL